MSERWPGETDITEAWEWKRSEAPTREMRGTASVGTTTTPTKITYVPPKGYTQIADGTYAPPGAAYDYYPMIEGTSEKTDEFLVKLFLFIICPPLFLVIWIMTLLEGDKHPVVAS